jgi:hypothetical protein
MSASSAVAQSYTFHLNGLKNVATLDNNRTVIFEFESAGKADAYFAKAAMLWGGLLGEALIKSNCDIGGNVNTEAAKRSVGFTIKTIGAITHYQSIIEAFTMLGALGYSSKAPEYIFTIPTK